MQAVHFVTFYLPLWGAILYNGFTYFQVIRMLNNATRVGVRFCWFFFNQRRNSLSRKFLRPYLFFLGKFFRWQLEFQAKLMSQMQEITWGYFYCFKDWKYKDPYTAHTDWDPPNKKYQKKEKIMVKRHTII